MLSPWGADRHKEGLRSETKPDSALGSTPGSWWQRNCFVFSGVTVLFLFYHLLRHHKLSPQGLQTKWREGIWVSAEGQIFLCLFPLKSLLTGEPFVQGSGDPMDSLSPHRAFSPGAGTVKQAWRGPGRWCLRQSSAEGIYVNRSC